MKDTLFIYGSFSEGMVHFDKISNYIKTKRNAVTSGTVYRLEVGFPVLINEGETTVPGTLVELNEPEMLFKLLDEFHGYNPQDPSKSLYNRSEIVVTAEGYEDKVTTYCYTFNPGKLPRSAKLVTDGNWQKSLQDQPPILAMLTERHKGYIRKLSESNRRDTIVYPLDVCRELERLQIIVDKGRRFALTNLGKEICRFI